MGARANRGIVAAGVLAAALVAAMAAGSERAEPADAAPHRPNIVLLLADDQHPETIEAMPFVSSRRDWISFEAAMVNTAQCCPARATLLTGQTSDHHGIRTNVEADRFDGRETIADWLQDAGYETAFIGKYFNEFPWHHELDFIPPGWDYWAAYAGRPQGYYSYGFNDNGKVLRPDAYATDLIADKAVEMIGSARRPFFAIVSFFAPHEPVTPAPRHAYAEVVPPPLDARFNQARMRGRPRWVRALPPLDVDQQLLRRKEHNRTLLAVDEAVGDVFAALRARGQLKNTIVIYSTDHGIAMGEHGYTEKTCAYEICSRVPFLVRVPGQAGRIEPALIGNIDFAPTVADYAGIEPGAPVDGRSLRALLEGRVKRIHRRVLLQRARGPLGVRYLGLRTKRFKYVRYPFTGERELYDLRSDPLELKNLIASGKPRWLRQARKLHRRMRELKRTPPR